MHTRITFRACLSNAFFLSLLMFVSMSAHADYNVNIGLGASSNGVWSGASPDVWTPSVSGATVSANEIQTRLAAGTSVTIVTSGGGSENGDITVAAPISWSNNSTFSLRALRDINLGANLTATGSAPGLVLGYGAGRDYMLTTGAKVTLSGSSASLKIGVRGSEAAYTVINDLGVAGDATSTTLQGIGNNLAGNYALGRDIDATPTAGWNAGTGFVGIGPGNCCTGGFYGQFHGLGHVISHLFTNSPREHPVGMFSRLVGSVRDVGLTDASITGDSAGGLVGFNYGTVANAYVTGNVTNPFFYETGGLVGMNCGTVKNSYATANVMANGVANDSAGGLVGGNDGGTIINSYATGNVAGNELVGGLAGYGGGSIVNSYATGSVTGNYAVGGLVGQGGGSVSDSYWNTETSGQATSAGGTGKTTAEMRHLATFTGWDISSQGGSNSAWRIYEGQTYPLLRSFLSSSTVTANDASKPHDGVPYSGGNGVTCSTGPCSATDYLGVVAYGGNSQGAVNIGSYTLTPTGLYSSQLGYDISFADGTLVIGTSSNVAPNVTSLAIGGTAQAGQVLTGSYVYGDAESDAQDTSGSGTSYRFVRSTDNSVATVGDNTDVASGATGGSNKTYTVQAADVGKYLFYCVTPRANAGTSPGAEACSVATAAISLIPQTIAGFAPASPVVVGATPLTLAASGGASGNPVVFATTSANTICTVSGTTVTFTGVGVCNLTANQAAAGNYAAAPQATASITVNASRSVSGTSPAGGPITAAFSVISGNGNCSYASTAFTTPSAPPGVSLPHGAFGFATNNCGAGAALSFTITYPQTLPAGSQVYKFGPTTLDPSNHWYVLNNPSVSISGNQITFTVTDNDVGDSNPAPGFITDPVAVGVPAVASGTASIPTLSEWGVILLSGLMALAGLMRLRRRQGQNKPFSA